MVFDPAVLDRLFIGTFHGVFKSRDGGATCMESSTGLKDLEVTELVIDPFCPENLYAGIHENDGAFKRSEGCSTRKEINNGLTDWYINALIIDPLTLTTLYAGTQGNGVFKSLDGGETWSETSSLASEGILSLAIDPVTPTDLYTGNLGGRMFKTVDGGVTALVVASGSPNPVCRN
jgi:hypothetical protein